MVSAVDPSEACQIRGAVDCRVHGRLLALGHLPLPRHPLRLQTGRGALLGAWCGGWGGVSTTDLVAGVNNRSCDQRARANDELGGE